MTIASHAFPIGYMLEEYRIDKVLGAGAFGVTYRATDTNLGMNVAIKEFFPNQYAQRDIKGNMVPKSSRYAEYVQWGQERFIAEGKILAQFKHPNIVRVTRYFQSHGTAFMVMDYEEGETLHNHIEKASRPPDETRLKSILIPILEGLQTVHEKQYLHRDLKPANIYLRRNGSPLLLDFGAARAELGNPDAESTVLLTPAYAPPEQYDPEASQCAASDLYSLGATMYRCIAARKPVDALERHYAAYYGMQDPLMSALSVGAGRYSKLLLETIDWMLTLEIGKRPQSAAQVLARLRGESTEEKKASPGFTYQPRRRHRSYKLVFAGPVNSGKTTAISVLSDIPTVNTETSAGEDISPSKKHTTMVMDYGMLRLSPNETVHLYGTPGQERFAFMREVLQIGALGLVVLVDNTTEHPFEHLEGVLDTYRNMIENTKVVVGLTRMDEQPRPTIEDYHQFLWKLEKPWCQDIPILEVDARQRKDVSTLVKSLLVSVDPELVI